MVSASCADMRCQFLWAGGAPQAIRRRPRPSTAFDTMAWRLARVVAAALLTFTIFEECKASEVQQQEQSRLMLERPWLYQYLMQSRYAPKDHDGHSPLLSPQQDQDLNADNTDEYGDKERGDKRSALATALNSGRRRRQPTPALGKAVTPYVGVGVLNDVDSFFDSLRDNLETLAALSPQQRATLLHEPPSVVNANAYGGGGGGSGIRRLHALRPLRPTGNIRSYNRRSLMDTEMYPGANHHDPGLLWAGLGR